MGNFEKQVTPGDGSITTDQWVSIGQEAQSVDHGPPLGASAWVCEMDSMQCIASRQDNSAQQEVANSC